MDRTQMIREFDQQFKSFMIRYTNVMTQPGLTNQQRLEYKSLLRRAHEVRERHELLMKTIKEK